MRLPSFPSAPTIAPILSYWPLFPEVVTFNSLKWNLRLNRLFTRSGNPAKLLAGALTQINNWKIFVEKERQTVLKELSKFATKRELLWKWHRIITDNVGWPLYHPQLWAKWSYHIIIGRRSTLSDRDLERKASYEAHDIDIVTYDRLIDAARRLDEHDEFVRQEFEKHKRSAKSTPGSPDGRAKLPA